MTKITREEMVKLGLSLLLLLCLFELPYGYYQLFRYLALVGFAVLTYFEFERRNRLWVLVFVALALLFQPFYKLGMGRLLWNIIDGVVAAGLIVQVIIARKKQRDG